MNNNCGCPENTRDRDHACKSTVKKPIDIFTPVSIEPTVRAGRIKTHCDRPRICWPTDCNRTCDFIIKQTIYVEIPMHYNVETDIGDSHIDCKA